MACRKRRNYTLLLQNGHLIRREDQKPLRYGKRRKSFLDDIRQTLMLEKNATAFTKRENAENHEKITFFKTFFDYAKRQRTCFLPLQRD